MDIHSYSDNYAYIIVYWHVHAGSQRTQSEGAGWPDGGAGWRQWLRKEYNGGAAAAFLRSARWPRESMYINFCSSYND